MATKDQVRTPAVEDYSKAIFALESRGDEPVSTNALAERLGITPGSVSAMLKRLDELGLITHVPYRGVRLTADGRRIALEVIRHHRLLESYLAEALGMPWDRVHAEAEVLEHVLSEDLEAADRREARAPDGRSPRRPDPERRPRARRAARPTAWRACSPATRACSCACRTPTRRCCATWPTAGISPGDRFAVRERQPFGGPLFVRFGEREHAIGGQLAGGDAGRTRSAQQPRPAAARSAGSRAVSTTEARRLSPAAPAAADRRGRARARTTARACTTRAGTAGAGICCGCSSGRGSSRCSARTTGRA